MTGATGTHREMNVLVCRGRDLSDRALLKRTLDQGKPDVIAPAVP